jgi:hypothetical protein
MTNFHEVADARLLRLENELVAAKSQFQELAAYVNGAAKSSVSDPQAFFSMLYTFAKDLDAAHADNTAADEKVTVPLPDPHCCADLTKLSHKRHVWGCSGMCLPSPAKLKRQGCMGLQAARRAEKAEKRGRKPALGGADASPPPLRQRDRMLSHVRAFQRLRPEDRHALLTEKVTFSFRL